MWWTKVYSSLSFCLKYGRVEDRCFCPRFCSCPTFYLRLSPRVFLEWYPWSDVWDRHAIREIGWHVIHVGTTNVLERSNVLGQIQEVVGQCGNGFVRGFPPRPSVRRPFPLNSFHDPQYGSWHGVPDSVGSLNSTPAVRGRFLPAPWAFSLLRVKTEIVVVRLSLLPCRLFLREIEREKSGKLKNNNSYLSLCLVKGQRTGVGGLVATL